MPPRDRMPAIWRQCEDCLDWRRDVVRRGDYVGNPVVCPHCARAFHAPTRSRASWDEQGRAPQEGGRDRLARFEEGLGRDLQARGRARRNAPDRPCDHRADAVPHTSL